MNLIPYTVKASRWANPPYAVIFDDPKEARVTKSAEAEIKGLLECGSYLGVSKSDIPVRPIIRKSIVQNSIKADQYINIKNKARLLIHGHKDPEKGPIVAEALTVSRAYTRLIISLRFAFEFEL